MPFRCSWYPNRVGEHQNWGLQADSLVKVLVKCNMQLACKVVYSIYPHM